jgi:hypothetical protein
MGHMLSEVEPAILAYCTFSSQFGGIHIVTIFANTVSLPVQRSV